MKGEGSKRASRRPPRVPDLSGKTLIVTGATSGIGRETARELAAMGARVTLAVRDEAKGRAVAATMPGEVEVLRLDLADLASVRGFARAFRAAHDRLDVLVNNAGLHTAQRVVTKDGHELTFQTNHLGPFLLTLELLDLLKASAPARVVNVASDAHRGGRLDFDDLMGERRWSGLKAYAQSKLANVEFTYELARRLRGAGVTANAVAPGSVRTGWARGEESGVFRFGVALASPFLLSPERGARTSVWAASAPELEGVTGQYLRRRKVARSAPWSYREKDWLRLWAESERLVGLGKGE